MSDSEGINDLVAFSRGNAEAIDTLIARLDKAEMDNMALRQTVTQIVNEANAGSRSAPGHTTRYHDATTSRISTPSTPTKECYKPFQTFRLSSPVHQDEESFSSKLTPTKKSKKGEKTRARKALKVKIPDGKKNAAPSFMTTPSKKIDVSSTCPVLHYEMLTKSNSLATSLETWPRVSPT